MSDLARATELMSYWTQLDPGAAARAVAEVLERERERGRKQATAAAVEWLRREGRAECGAVRTVSEALDEAAAELEACAHLEDEAAP